MADILHVLSPGLLSTLQDAGRKGWQASGFAPGGAMDLPAMRMANLLVGNSMDMPVLEMTITGISARFGCDTHIALTGADFNAYLNDMPLRTYQAFRVHAGDELHYGNALTGCRSYLAIAGGFDVEPVLGSCSTNLKCGIGGYEGRKLRAGDALPLQCPQAPLDTLTERRLPVPEYFERMVLRAVPGPQDSMFTQAGTAAFYGSWYAVTPASDRMGIKLEGAKIKTHKGSDIISDGIAAGSVQVPVSGHPIVMMADRQTTGGYAKIATVISADLPILAQARPGDYVRFIKISIKEAQDIARRKMKELRALEREFEVTLC